MNITWNFSGRIISSAVGFLMGVLVVRFLGPSKYGLLSYSVSFAGLFSFISNFGIDTILYRELVKYPERRDEFLGTAFLIKIFGAMLAFFLALLTSILIGNNQHTTLFISIIAFAGVFQSLNVISFYFQSKALSKFPALIILFTSIFLSLLKVLLVFLKAPLIYFVLVFLLEGVILFIGFIYIYVNNNLHILNWKINLRLILEMIKDSWPLMFAGAFTLIYNRIDQVLIKHLLDESAVGVYDVAVRFSELWLFVPAIIVSSLFPAIVNAKKTDMRSYRNRMVKLYSLLIYSSIIIIVPMFFLAGPIVTILYGKAFAAATGVIKIYVWVGISVSIGTVLNYYLINENYTGLSLFSNFIGMSSNVLLNVTLIPIYGTAGAAVATLISYSLVPISVLFFGKTRHQGLLILQAIFLK